MGPRSRLRAHLTAALVVLVAASACAPRTGRSPDASTAPAGPGSPRTFEPSGPPHADFAALRPFRNYFRIVSVGPFVHHLRTFSIQREIVANDYQLSIDGTRCLLVGDEHGFSGPFADDYPPSARAQVNAVTRDLRARGVSGAIQVHYLGEYRQIELEEIVASDDPGDPTRRHAAYDRAALRADEALTRILGPVTEGLSTAGGSRDSPLCGRMTRDCHEPPHWLDARADSDGTLRISTMLYGQVSAYPSVIIPFFAAAIASARAVVDGEPSTPLRDLAVQKEPGLVSTLASDRMSLQLLVDVRRPGLAVEQSGTTVQVSLRKALAGEVRVESTLLAGGADFAFKATVHATATDPEAVGVQSVALTVEFWLTMPGFSAHETAPFRLSAALDGSRAMPLARPAPDPDWVKAHPGVLDHETTGHETTGGFAVRFGFID
jgi:hypothetical protein